jgi:hypothetical protein
MRWVAQKGIPLVTASNVTAYDEEDMKIFRWECETQLDLLQLDLISRSFVVGFLWLKRDDLPRQARDNLQENSKREGGMGTFSFNLTDTEMDTLDHFGVTELN